MDEEWHKAIAVGGGGGGSLQHDGGTTYGRQYESHQAVPRKLRKGVAAEIY